MITIPPSNGILELLQEKKRLAAETTADEEGETAGSNQAIKQVIKELRDLNDSIRNIRKNRV
jgi:hypothetical protein